MIKIKTTPSYDCDVLIVGAGPAGSAAAARLSKAGFSTWVIDSSKFPRDKVCGDFVGPVAIKELETLGVTERVDFRMTNSIREASVYLDGRQLIRHPIPEVPGLPSYGKVVPRMQLDEWILEAARTSGAKILERHRLRDFRVENDTVYTECEERGKKKYICSRLLIGADGSNSTVGRILTGTKYASENRILAVRAYFENINGPSNRADLYFTEKSFPGYYWLFPTSSANANVGVGMVLETLPRNETHLKDLLNDLVQHDKALRTRIGKGKITGKVVGWPLSTYDPNFKIVADRVMLTGDAAGLINSLNGEGIQYALLSGRWAAEIADQCLQKNKLDAQALGDYVKLVKDNLGYELALSRLIIQFIRNRTFNSLWLKLLEIIVARAKVDPKYADTAGGVLAGIVPANQVLNTGFITNTVMQGGIVLGMDGIREVIKGPNQWKHLGNNAFDFAKHITQEVLDKPGDYGRWSVGLLKDGIDLLLNAASHNLTNNNGSA